MSDTDFLEIYVSLNTVDQHGRVFEFDIVEYEGEAVDAMLEGIGVDYWLVHVEGVAEELSSGSYYRFEGLGYTYTPGVYWTQTPDPTDAYEEWDFDVLIKRTDWVKWLWQKILNAWRG